MTLSRLTPASELAENYVGWLCDVWGVLHNGVAAFPAAVDALCRYRAGGGRVVLITNAPRQSSEVLPQLAQLGVPDEAFDLTVTSGDVTRKLVEAQPDAPLYHLGPVRDNAMLEGLKNPLVGLEDAAICLLTGAVNDETETADDYNGQLSVMLANKVPLICANPDLVVRRGDRLVICAGAIAQRYEEMGGEVMIAGKPRAPIYEAAMAEMSRLVGREVVKDELLAVGDGLPTDVRGGAENGFDVYFLTAGIHEKELGPMSGPDGPAKVASKVQDQFPGITLAGICDELRWT